MTQREIKFRAMRDDMNPSWVYGSLLYGGDIPRIQELPLFSLFTTCLKGTEGQFTGLQDKNRKDIYEWDLISNRSGRVCRVEWHQPTGAWDATPIGSKGDSLWFMASNWNRHIEVIGNIYENPELLK